jgi:hypothetical protein
MGTIATSSDMQHVVPLEQQVVKHIQVVQLQHGQLYQGIHALLASRRCTLSSPSVLHRVQGVLRKPTKVAFLHGHVVSINVSSQKRWNPTRTAVADEPSYA